MRDVIKPDAIFWTGDNSPHDGASGDRAIYEAAYSMNQTADMIKKAFPDKVDNIFAVLGNHDVYPHWDFSKNDGNPAAN
jgi:hypothetical protein